MPENRFPCGLNNQAGRDLVCIETNRILDSCRDRDCFENVRVLLTDFGYEIIDHTSSIRVRHSELLSANISIDPVRFNCGFYSVNIKFFVKLTFEACVGGHSQEFDGVAVLEKSVVLFGGDNQIKTFRSNDDSSGDYCAEPCPCLCTKNTPTAVVDVVEPIILGVRVLETGSDCCCCCCRACDVPNHVASGVNGVLNDGDGGRKYLAVSIGLFSVVRIVRPGQYLISATEYSVPDKECVSRENDDPCSVFQSMPFPTAEFSSQSKPHHVDAISGKGCNC
ncbi:MAG: hypothetical protein J6B55_04505 [Clostridia bacterium]|nr:hypothetical protein [Clostridia bacterium]